MQTLHFFGNGSGFTQHHNNAYFEHENSLIIIDLSMLNFYKAIELNLQKYDNILLCITHMHDDHVSGIGLFIQYLYYNCHKKINIVTPRKLKRDFLTEMYLKGVDCDAFRTIYPEDVCREFHLKIKAVVTNHSPELDGKCYGYIFDFNDKHIIYSGDTVSFFQFATHLQPNCELYLDMSAKYGKVHILYSDVETHLVDLAKRFEIYLMHIDDMALMRKLIEGTNVKIAEMD